VTTVEQLAAEVADLQRRVATSEGILAIQKLKGRYAELVDQRFSAGAVIAADALAAVAGRVADLFTADGVWDGGPGLGSVTGRPAIAARLSEPTLIFSRHFFLNPRIEVDGQSARGRWDLLSPCRRADGGSYWMSGYEDDEYACVDGVWLHRSMKLTTVFMTPVGEGWTRVFV
jgi:SnoaL-like protein